MDRKQIDIALVLVGLAMGIILFLVPKTATVTIVCLIALFAFLVHPIIYLVTWLSKRVPRNAIGRICLAEIALLAGVLGFGYYVWPPKNQEPITSEQAPQEQKPATKIEQAKRPTAEEIAAEVAKRIPAASSEPTSTALPLELQLRDPVLIIEPEHGSMFNENGARKFNLTLYNAGTSDVERIEIYEDYFRLADLNPPRFEVTGPMSDAPDSTISSLRSKERKQFAIDTTKAKGAIERYRSEPGEKKIYYFFVRVKLRYRRSLDGVAFTMSKVMIHAGNVLSIGSRRDMPPSDWPLPTISEVEELLGGTGQKREP